MSGMRNRRVTLRGIGRRALRATQGTAEFLVSLAVYLLQLAVVGVLFLAVLFLFATGLTLAGAGQTTAILGGFGLALLALVWLVEFTLD